MQRSLISDIIANDIEGEVNIAVWIQDTRSLKNVIFLTVRDTSGMAQVTIRKGTLDNEEKIVGLNRESVIAVKGKWDRKSASKLGVDIVAEKIEILNESLAPLPLGVDDPVEADFDTRLNNRFIDIRKPEKALIFQIESTMLWGIRKFFNSQEFIEVHTPKIVAAATEGGADLFSVKYFEKEAYLNQSPQLYKEILMSCGLDRVFEVGPAFRAEQHNTTRHLNEFTSIDIEVSFADHNDAMAFLENAIKHGVDEMLSRHSDQMEKHGIHVDRVKTPFPRITYEECRKLINDAGMNLEFGDDFSPEQLKVIGNKFNGFYFIIDWPSSMRPFYTMPKPEDPALTNSFDLQFNELEITSGAQRVHNPEILEKRFLDKGLNPSEFDFYIKAFKYGMPPHAGWAIGLERLVMILCGLPNIREATLFPRDRTRIVP
ncbi:aspartate--tRNA ligase [uncultured archaeon]|nr:aspartate--tRNA ligase [uncultured archaeon]